MTSNWRELKLGNRIIATPVPELHVFTGDCEQAPALYQRMDSPEGMAKSRSTLSPLGLPCLLSVGEEPPNPNAKGSIHAGISSSSPEHRSRAVAAYA
ncbi:MAG: hypothetical protein ACRECO_12620 [Xanthobacteraceae bacterium]